MRLIFVHRPNMLHKNVIRGYISLCTISVGICIVGYQYDLQHWALKFIILYKGAAVAQ